MPSWRPPHAGSPNGPDEWRFRPLADLDPHLAARLLDRYGPRWLAAAGLPLGRLAEVPDTVDLRRGPDGLRLTSWYTGSTYWLGDWDGSLEAAEAWIDDVADLQAANATIDREYGPGVWDHPDRWEPPPPRHGPAPITYEGIVEEGDAGEASFVPSIDAAQDPRDEAGAEPAEPVDCVCGAALLDPGSWRGRAVVRCGRCGRRWAVEVGHAQSWSRWSADPASPGR
jgi:hypothetical protein